MNRPDHRSDVRGPGEEDPTQPPLPAYDPSVVPDRQDDPAPGAAAPSTTPSEEEREQALERIEERAAFRWHLLSYVLVMLLLNGIWLATIGPGGFYWPIFPMMGWGMGLAFHGAGLYFDREPSEEEITAEVERRRGRVRRELGR